MSYSFFEFCYPLVQVLRHQGRAYVALAGYARRWCNGPALVVLALAISVVAKSSEGFNESTFQGGLRTGEYWIAVYADESICPTRAVPLPVSVKVINTNRSIELEGGVAGEGHFWQTDGSYRRHYFNGYFLSRIYRELLCFGIHIGAARGVRYLRDVIEEWFPRLLLWNEGELRSAREGVHGVAVSYVSHEYSHGSGVHLYSFANNGAAERIHQNWWTTINCVGPVFILGDDVRVIYGKDLTNKIYERNEADQRSPTPLKTLYLAGMLPMFQQRPLMCIMGFSCGFFGMLSAVICISVGGTWYQFWRSVALLGVGIFIIHWALFGDPPIASVPARYEFRPVAKKVKKIR